MRSILGVVQSLTFPEALMYSLIGFAVVFLVLVVLMAVIRVLRTLMEKIEADAPDGPAYPVSPQSAAASVISSGGSKGEVNLFTVDDPTAAMLMAIVADTNETPLHEMQFRYICEEGTSDPKDTSDTLSKPAKYRLTMNGKHYEVGVERCEPIMTDAPAAAAAAATPVPPPANSSAAAPPPTGALVSGEPVKAPLPGTVLAIQTCVGQAVKAGQVLLILEAMKMENEIVAPRDGVVAQIITSKGSTVETGAVLMTLN